MSALVVPTHTVDAKHLQRDLEALHGGIQVDVTPLIGHETLTSCDHCGMQDCPASVFVSWRTHDDDPVATRVASVGPDCAWRLLATEVIGRHVGPIYVQIVGWPR